MEKREKQKEREEAESSEYPLKTTRVHSRIPRFSLQELNPFTEPRVVPEGTSRAAATESSFLKENGINVVVCASPDCSLEEHIALDKRCRDSGVAYLGAGAHGKAGFFVSDFGRDHHFKRSAKRKEQCVSF